MDKARGIETDLEIAARKHGLIEEIFIDNGGNSYADIPDMSADPPSIVGRYKLVEVLEISTTPQARTIAELE